MWTYDINYILLKNVDKILYIVFVAIMQKKGVFIMENCFSIQPKERRRAIGKYFYMGAVIVRFDGREYEAIIIFDTTRDRPDTRGIIGWKILARNCEALKRMIFDIAELYPPRREINVRIWPCDTLIGSKNDINEDNEEITEERRKGAKKGKYKVETIKEE